MKSFGVMVFVNVLFCLSPSLVLATTYYVSPTGSNQSANSWSNAWNELDQINWNVVQPGDTVAIDGGSTPCTYPVKLTGIDNTPLPDSCGLVYQTVLNVNAQGTAASPITVKLSTDPGHNGTARFFGGRSTLMTSCEGGGSAPRSYGINLQNADYVTVDGSHWSGIMVYGYGSYGIGLVNANCVSAASAPTNITVRYVEVYDNGGSRGIRPGGTNLLFDRILVHDNGQDSFQVDSFTTNFVINHSWLYNSRPSISNPKDSFFSACTHSDGVQIYAGGEHTGFTVTDSIIGPGHMHSFMLGDINTSNSCIATTTVSDVTIRNTILVGDHGPSNEDTIHTKANSNVLQDNYVLDHVTSVRDNNQPVANVSIKYGTGRRIASSLFVGGTLLTVLNPSSLSNNYCYHVNDANQLCETGSLNPDFTDASYDGVWGDPFSADNDFANFNFTVTNPSIPAGVGASIHSVADFFGESAIPSTTPLPAPPADLDADHDVDFLDLAAFLPNFSFTITSPADINHDNLINIFDFGALLSALSTAL